MLNAIFALGLLPSIFPTWRGTLISAGALYSSLILGFLLLLQQVEALPTGEGSAFFGLIMLFAVATTTLTGSCTFKFAFGFILSRLQPLAASRLRRSAIWGGIVFTGVFTSIFLADTMLRGVATTGVIASVWISITAWMTPDIPSRPNPSSEPTEHGIEPEHGHASLMASFRRVISGAAGLGPAFALLFAGAVVISFVSSIGGLLIGLLIGASSTRMWLSLLLLPKIAGTALAVVSATAIWRASAPKPVAVRMLALCVPSIYGLFQFIGLASFAFSTLAPGR